MGRSNNIIHPTRGKIILHQQELLRAGDDERSKDRETGARMTNVYPWFDQTEIVTSDIPGTIVGQA